MRHLHVGPCALDLRFWLEDGEHARWEVLSVTAQHEHEVPAEHMVRVVEESLPLYPPLLLIP